MIWEQSRHMLRICITHTFSSESPQPWSSSYSITATKVR
ncbi:hypothetical protein HDF15_000910 [Granulicella mallensis]|uniref:Uncharacterized protein n=1 Tax=Granulicella mallensis TaxID=940614 RepID=A0A7W7ZMA9_9BACT|nr:hypothetical protein [Granulicella mallensis]